MLVLEDVTQVRTLTAQILQEPGYRTEVAEHGQAAMESLAAESEIVLSDVVLPSRNGSQQAAVRS